MKNCARCGLQNADEAAYCQDCGSKFEQSAPMAGGAPAAPAERLSMRTPRSGAVEILRRFGSSPAFLAALVALTAGIVLSLLSSLLSAGADYSAFLRSLPVYTETMAPIFRVIGQLAPQLLMALSALLQVPNILICAGLWTLYASCSRDSAEVSAGALGFVRVVTIVQFCLFGAAIAAVAAFFAFWIPALSVPGYSARAVFAGALLAGALLGVAVVAVPTVFYYLKALKTIKRVTLTAKTGAPLHDVSVYLPVVNFVAAFFMVIGLFSSVSFYGSMGYLDMDRIYRYQGAAFQLEALPSLLASLAQAVFLVIVSVLLLQYRSRMRLEAYYGARRSAPPPPRAYSPHVAPEPPALGLSGPPHPAISPEVPPDETAGAETEEPQGGESPR